ncbi:MAG TPA: HEAT repeat domain-containing protein [Bryobacteraceae bacterium]|jgi:hypothetical protein|nr:HEAT repeat domain-containing protein [Bryobacteraceae bacterium]
MITCEQARAYFVDTWRGELDGEAGWEFHAHLDNCAGCRREVEELRSVWEGLGALPRPEPDAGLRTDFYSSLREWQRRDSERRRPLWWARHPVAQGIAAAILLVAGIGIGRLTLGHEEEKFTNLQREVNDMRQMVALSLLQQQSASDRLKGVSWTYRVEQSDIEVQDALLHTLKTDPNENVRLAAVDALRKFSHSPETRAGLVQALTAQRSPIVQVAIVDELVDLGDKSSVQTMNGLLGQPELNPSVRKRVQWAVGQLQ